MTSLRLAVLGALAAGMLTAGRAAAQADGRGFAQAYEQLRRGPEHARKVPTGRIETTREGEDGLAYRYVLIVPEDYDPARRYPVAFYLHGGVGRPDPGPGGGWWRNYDVVTGHDRIAVLPLSWPQSLWWQSSQIENLHAILSAVKRTYNVDENHVCLIGVSDGGTGAWFFAFRSPTPWSSFLPFSGSPFVLTNPDVGADGALFVPNLHDKALLVINGSEDPLYPAESLRGLMDFVGEVGAELTFEVVEGAGHGVGWWRDRAGAIDAFIESHGRDPLPDFVFWATERADRYNRAYWVVVDELAPDGSRGRSDLATLGSAPETFGGIELRRRGNTVDARAIGIRRYRLLLSPEEFDLDTEVVVNTNGQESFRGVVPRDLSKLLDWAARDMDRRMLFAAELCIEVPPSAPGRSGDAPQGPGQRPGH